MNQLPRKTEILAVKLAKARGVSPEEAVALALEESLAQAEAASATGAKLTGDDLVRRTKEISARYRALPLLDPRSPDEILGYDEFGLPI